MLQMLQSKGQRSAHPLWHPHLHSLSRFAFAIAFRIRIRIHKGRVPLGYAEVRSCAPSTQGVPAYEKGGGEENGRWSFFRPTHKFQILN